MTFALRPSDVAKRWQCSTRQVQKLCERGQRNPEDPSNLRAFRVGRMFRITIDEIERFECLSLQSEDSKDDSPSQDSVEQFAETHQPGTKPWLALQLHLYTAARRSDVVRFGPINVRGDRLRWIQKKNETSAPVAMDIPLLPVLADALRLCEPILGETTFLTTDYGKPFTINGYGNKFRNWCDQAGLKGLSSHGIRKLVGINAAMNNATAKQIQELLGHSSIEEGETYIRQANRAKLADQGFAAAWET